MCPRGNIVLALVTILFAPLLASAQEFKSLYTFCSTSTTTVGCTDGENPQAGLVRDAAGNLYGTTVNGGAFGFGAVFKLDPAGRETVLYNFCSTSTSTVSCTDGSAPVAGVTRDAAGNLYGGTAGGGRRRAPGGPGRRPCSGG